MLEELLKGSDHAVVEVLLRPKRGPGQIHPLPARLLGNRNQRGLKVRSVVEN